MDCNSSYLKKIFYPFVIDFFFFYIKVWFYLFKNYFLIKSLKDWKSILLTLFVILFRVKYIFVPLTFGKFWN